jgi:saccharopine dehydrogenase (NAD+, L-lysine-forming)
VDCNAGDHGYPFATNFNPEVNLREVTSKGRYYENGQWIVTEPFSISETFDFPEIGPRRMYLIGHEELESLAKHIPTLKRARFWMTFTDQYLTHVRVLQNIGMISIDPVDIDGCQITPLLFLKALLPDPATLGKNYTGKVCIGCVVEGVKDGKPKKYFVYCVVDHQKAYQEVQSQAISYTAGVPPMIGAMLILTGAWRGKGVFNVEQLDPDPFMEKLGHYGLPWQDKFLT